MFKKMLLSVMIISVGLLAVGCNKSSKELDTIKGAQTKLSSAQSGHIVVQTALKTARKTDATITDFSYKANASGIFTYCQEAKDSGGKVIFCEVGDGEKAEQWLIGKGWEVVEPISYTTENQHRFVSLITSPLDGKTVASTSTTVQDNGTIYTLTMNADALNNTIYKDTAIKLTSQIITYLVDAKGDIIEYTDTAIIEDTELGETNEYSVSVSLDQIGTVVEVKTPEVKQTVADAEQNPDDMGTK